MVVHDGCREEEEIVMHWLDYLDTVGCVAAVLMAVWALLDGSRALREVSRLSERVKALDVVLRTRMDRLSEQMDARPDDDRRVAAAVRDLSRAMRPKRRAGR